MAIRLFEHNQQAYEAALVQLAETGKAAIVHPTGTGKSFIGFKLCEEHPDSTVVWLSPSEYIFRTQLENLKKADEPSDTAGDQKVGKPKTAKVSEPSDMTEATEASRTAKEATARKASELSKPADGTRANKPSGNDKAQKAIEPSNIKFFTYAKLMYLTEAELREIKPDYFILDEFHRCGSEVWGSCVQKLLAMYPEVPVLGLSATSVRYLDNQRDMSDELFDGNVASEMTLGEAIVRGILKAPLYISTVYKYQKELERYERKLKSQRYAPVRDKAREYLDKLRRTLEKSDGLDVVFEKHMPDKHGKYLVFCANREHLDEMVSHVPEWFGKIDKAPQVYRVYSDNADAEAEFDNFKKDESRHLRLLFCIDMLNEGVHVDGIDGVILFRPTVSPTVYKQQIGRALTAGKGGTPVIFDIINNFENLYSMGSIEQEMAVAVTYYNSLGEGGMVVNERFEIVGVVQECVELFDKINEALTASWQEMYLCAKAYFGEHGNLDVPKNYRTEGGLSLRNWLDTQRRVRNGTVNGILTEERIALLDKIGMRWETYADMSWERNYAEAKKYFDQNGDLNPAALYVTENGVKLGSWLSTLRTYRKSGIRNAYLTAERITKLDEIGMVWNVPDYIFERNYTAALEYFHEHGNLDVPAKYVTADGIRLGAWLSGLRSQRNRRELAGAGDSVELCSKDIVKQNTAKKDSKRLKNQNPEEKIVFEVNQMRTKDKHAAKKAEAKNGTPFYGGLNAEQIQRLNEIGMVWENKFSRAWENGFAHAKAYFEEHGNLDVPATYICQDGYLLGKWIARNREEDGGIKVTEERRKRLDAIGMVWKNRISDSWEARFKLAQKYYQENGTLDVPQDYVMEGVWIGKWVYEQRQIFLGKKKGKSITAVQAKMLEEIGMSWDSLQEKQWENGFSRLVQYKAVYGNVTPAMAYRTEDGVLLGRWVYHQKKKYTDGLLNIRQIERLRSIGLEL